MDKMATDPARDDPYVKRFLTSPVYLMALRDTIKTAAGSYRVARALSVILFSAGLGLIAVAVFFAFVRNQEAFSIIFGAIGTANLFALLLYRPIERIQTGVDTLIRSQIACLGFMAQYDSIARTLATMSELPLKDTDRGEQLRLATFLRDSASQLLADLAARPGGAAEPLAEPSKDAPDTKRAA